MPLRQVSRNDRMLLPRPACYDRAAVIDARCSFEGCQKLREYWICSYVLVFISCLLRYHMVDYA